MRITEIDINTLRERYEDKETETNIDKQIFKETQSLTETQKETKHTIKHIDIENNRNTSKLNQ